MRPGDARVLVLVIGLGVVMVGCGGAAPATTAAPIGTPPPTGSGGSTPSTGSATPSDEATTTPSALPSASYAASFGDLPFTLELPPGWVFAPGADVEGALADLARSDPTAADALRRILAEAGPTTSGFAAVMKDDPDVTLGGNTADTGGLSRAVVLDRLQRQNLDAISSLPALVGPPSSDRITLPVGEVVRVRWQTHDLFGPNTGDIAAIGYAFPVGSIAYTFVFSAPPARIAALERSFEDILRTFQARPRGTAGAGPAGCEEGTDVVARHEAPRLEAILPERVAGQTLATWSVGGRCWVEMTVGLQDPEVDGFVAEFQAQAGGQPIDLSNLAYAVAGRSDTKLDPPYFVFAAYRPDSEAEIGLTLLLLFGGAAFDDVSQAMDLRTYERRTIAGKEIYVGTSDMLAQTDHQRGRPYLYQTDRYLFLVITDDPAWAEDAIAQLPR